MQSEEGGLPSMPESVKANRIARLLTEAKMIREVARHLSLRQEHAAVLQSALELERLAAALQASRY